VRKRWCLMLGGLVAASFGAVPATAAGAADKKAFCATNVKINLLFNQLGNSSSTGQPSAAAINQAKGKILPLVDAALKAAPADIVGQVTIESTIEHADFQKSLDDPADAQASTAIDQWALTNCGFKVINVTGMEYAYVGMPTAIKPGTVLFNFKNAGTQIHELRVVRIKTKDSVKTLLGLPKGEPHKRTEFITQTGSGPGQSSVAYAQFTTPGRYVAVCLVPDGTTPAQMGTGPPHASKGMYAEFKVT
jgi:hypothetical protein